VRHPPPTAGGDYNDDWRTRESVSAGFISVMTKIRILVTGGTFDKKYDELTGRLFFRDTHVPEMLRLGRCRLEVTIETVMMIDSLELKDDGRARIVARARDSDESAIVVTHGTDTMVQTARAIAHAGLAKTVVLTGAMVPYAFGSSDGLFNLGSALSFVQVLPAGVYIAMNGQHFPWNVVRKNTDTGTFELVNTP
jgi:L-asparaginase